MCFLVHFSLDTPLLSTVTEGPVVQRHGAVGTEQQARYHHSSGDHLQTSLAPAPPLASPRSRLAKGPPLGIRGKTKCGSTHGPHPTPRADSIAAAQTSQATVLTRWHNFVSDLDRFSDKGRFYLIWVRAVTWNYDNVKNYVERTSTSGGPR